MAIFLFEERQYPLQKIEEFFDRDFIDNLRKRKICQDIEDKDNIKFQFVGLILYKNNIFFVLPKYINHRNRDDLYFRETMTTILKVIRKYEKSAESFQDRMNVLNIGPNDIYTSTFALARYIIEDYLNYGYYKKTKLYVTNNGFGQILWDKTVDEKHPIIYKNTPNYFDYYTLKENVDDINVIYQLHKWAVSYCYQLYGEWLGFSKLNIEPFNIDLSDIGSRDYLLGVLNRELNLTFIDQKVNLLKALKSLVLNTFDFSANNVDIYGVRHFEHVWEKVCGYVFDNQYEKYKEKIPKPVWISADGNIVEKETFKPDILKQTNINGKDYFFILDAKYYNIRFTESDVIGNPSVNDVAKQLLYYLALKEITKDKITRNSFLFPVDKNQSEIFSYFGKVTLDFIHSDPVFLVSISADKLYDKYLTNSKFEEEDYKVLESILKV